MKKNKMLMLWEDLMPGDVVRFSKGARERYGYDDYFPEKLIIENVIIIPNMEIKIVINGVSFYINFDGTDADRIFLNGPLFEIVSLKDE